MRLAVLPLAFALFAAPASAQIVINGSHQASASQRERVGTRIEGQGWRSEMRQLDRHTRRAEERGEISHREARSIHRQVRLIENLGATYALNGLTDAELQVLDSQAFALRDLAQAPGRPVPPRRGH